MADKNLTLRNSWWNMFGTPEKGSTSTVKFPTLTNGMRRYISPFYENLQPSLGPSGGLTVGPSHSLRAFDWFKGNTFTAHEDYPKSRGPEDALGLEPSADFYNLAGGSLGWTYNLQGVTHDDDHWYFSARFGSLRKFHRLVDLDSDEPSGMVTFDVTAIELKSEEEYSKTGRPVNTFARVLFNSGYRHYGGLSHYKGYLFVAVEWDIEGTGVPLCQLFTKDLDWIGAAELSQSLDNSAPFVAVNPVDRRLYSCMSNFAEAGPVDLNVYDIDMAAIESRGVNEDVTNFLAPIRSIPVDPEKPNIQKYPLRLMRDRDDVFRARNITSGAFSKNGHLYLAIEFPEGYPGGVFAFDITTGMLVKHFAVDFKPSTWWKTHKVKLESHIAAGGVLGFLEHVIGGIVTGWSGATSVGTWITIGTTVYSLFSDTTGGAIQEAWDILVGNADEIEAVTVWEDLRGAPSIEGQIHVVVLKRASQLYLKHYSVPDAKENI